MTMWWFKSEVSPTGLCILIFAPQLAGLFGEVMDPVGGGALLEEVHQFGGL